MKPKSITIGFEFQVRVGRVMEDIERQVIEAALRRHGSQREAAAHLGIGVRTIGMKLSKWRKEDAKPKEAKSV